MAIYKNREVTVSNVRAIDNDTVNVTHTDGTHEAVKLSQIQFTQAEKDALVKSHPSRFDNVKLITDADLQAVRLGTTPPSDPILKEQAMAKVRHRQQTELTQKNTDAATAQAEKDVAAQPKPAQISTTPSTNNIFAPKTPFKANK